MIRPNLMTFLTVCETGSFSKAAAKLYMTPSAVLQQMRSLEKEIGTSLFIRTSTGISLTPAGSCLKDRVPALISLSQQIRREALHAASKESRICIATSLMEKVRLLSDLWMLYSQQETDCRIQMLGVDRFHHIPEETDLIESINSGVDWMRQWEFLEICQVPLVFAVPNDHPLAEHKKITLSDLRSERVLSINSGSCDAIFNLLKLLEAHHISVECNTSSETNMLWESAFRKDVLIVPQCWQDILINMQVIPFEEEFTLPYGIFYRTDPSPAVRHFLDFVYATYHDGNRQGIVPVLS